MQSWAAVWCVLIGDWGQLPPVMDLLLYTTVSSTEIWSANYRSFDSAAVLDRVMWQAGDNHISVTCAWPIYTWRLMRRTPAEARDTTPPCTSIQLRRLCKSMMWASCVPVINLWPVKAIHSGHGASKASSDDVEPVIYIAHGARVMLTVNLWG